MINLCKRLIDKISFCSVKIIFLIQFDEMSKRNFILRISVCFLNHSLARATFSLVMEMRHYKNFRTLIDEYFIMSLGSVYAHGVL